MNKKTLASILLTVSTAFSNGCIADLEKPELYTAEEIDTNNYDTPQVRFAEWMVENKVNVYTAPDWCSPCQVFDFDITDEGVKTLKDGGNYFNCSKYQNSPLTEDCHYEQIIGFPTFKAPFLQEPIEGYDINNGLITLGYQLNYPKINELIFQKHNL